MPLSDKLAELLGGEGVVVPDGFMDAIMAEHEADLATSTGELNTIIGLRDQAIQELQAKAAIETIPDADKETFDELDDDELPEGDFDDFFSDDPEDEGKWDGR